MDRDPSDFGAMPEMMYDEEYALALDTDIDDPKATTRLLHADFFNSMNSNKFNSNAFVLK
jgi:hypothetical protein